MPSSPTSARKTSPRLGESQPNRSASVTALLLALVLGATSCSQTSPLVTPTSGPRVPPLPPQAHQPAKPPECQPTCLDALWTELSNLRATPTKPASQAKPASAPTKP